VIVQEPLFSAYYSIFAGKYISYYLSVIKTKLVLINGGCHVTFQIFLAASVMMFVFWDGAQHSGRRPHSVSDMVVCTDCDFIPQLKNETGSSTVFLVLLLRETEEGVVQVIGEEVLQQEMRFPVS
jgi:hypothetical protein